MNRPKTENPRQASITLRTGTDVKAAIEKAAEADHRTMSQWVELTLIERLQRDGYLPKPKKGK